MFLRLSYLKIWISARSELHQHFRNPSSFRVLSLFVFKPALNFTNLHIFFWTTNRNKTQRPSTVVMLLQGLITNRWILRENNKRKFFYRIFLQLPKPTNTSQLQMFVPLIYVSTQVLKPIVETGLRGWRANIVRDSVTCYRTLLGIRDCK